MRTAVKTVESAPWLSPSPRSSARAKQIAAPTTAWIVVVAGPKMLARRFMGSRSHTRQVRTRDYRTARRLMLAACATQRLGDGHFSSMLSVGRPGSIGADRRHAHGVHRQEAVVQQREQAQHRDEEQRGRHVHAVAAEYCTG